MVIVSISYMRRGIRNSYETILGYLPFHDIMVNRNKIRGIAPLFIVKMRKGAQSCTGPQVTAFCVTFFTIFSDLSVSCGVHAIYTSVIAFVV